MQPDAVRAVIASRARAIARAHLDMTGLLPLDPNKVGTGFEFPCRLSPFAQGCLMNQGLAGGGLGGVGAAPAPTPAPAVSAPAGGLTVSDVGVPGRSSDGVEIASSFAGCRFDEVGVAVRVDAELVGAVPE